MKPRRLLSAGEVVELHLMLERKLDRVGLQTQPEIAIKILELSNRANAQVAEYADIIRNDRAIAGRVLRLANSAFFVQRRAVTTIDRACVVLGIERLKAVSLGFSLGKAMQTASEGARVKQLWGESVLRACLASHFARYAAPGLVSEAFVIGLMMDAAVPLMRRLAGDDYARIEAQESASSPGRLYRVEFEQLPFTHVDVVATLARKWKLPDVLARPLEWHHTRPPDTRRDDAVGRLHRVSYVVGLLELCSQPGVLPPVPSAGTPGIATSQRLLGLSDHDLQDALSKTGGEYSSTLELFAELAQAVPDLESVLERVQSSLAGAVDSMIEQQIMDESNAKPARIVIHGQYVELACEPNGGAVAYLFDTAGNRLLAHRFSPRQASGAEVCRSLGLEDASHADITKIDEQITRLAA